MESLVDGGTTNSLTNVILNSLMVLWGLIMEEINGKLICFHFDGVLMIYSVHNNVTTHIPKRKFPLMFVVHVLHIKQIWLSKNFLGNPCAKD
jgi:hypothetical protein